MDAVIDWLVANGLFPAIIYAVVAIVLTWLAHRTLRELRRITNHLDTHTEGGLRDVVELLRRLVADDEGE